MWYAPPELELMGPLEWRRQVQTEQPSRIARFKPCMKRVKHVEYHVVGRKLLKIK